MFKLPSRTPAVAASVLTAVLTVALSLHPATAAPLTFQQIALTGDVAPDAGGAEFNFFNAPALNAAGDVAFLAGLRTGDSGPTVDFTNDSAIFGPTPSAGGGLGIVARAGDPAPDAGGAEFNSFGSPALNAAGDVAFAAFLRTGETGPTVTGSNNQAIFGPTPSGGGGLGIVAREDDPAPDAGGAEFSLLSDVSLNTAGDVAFRAVLRTGDTGPTVSSNKRDAIFGPTPSGGLGLLARQGDPAPDAGGAEFDFFNTPALNAAGDVAFRAFLRSGDTGPTVSGDNDYAIFGPTLSGGGGLGLLAREDDPAPGAGGAEFDVFNNPALNAAGDVAFFAVLRTGDSGSTVTGDNNDAIFGPTPSGGLGIVAREGDPAPDAGGAEFSGFGNPALNAAGDVAFLAGLRTGDSGPTVTGTNNGALYALVDGEFQLIVREGDLFTVTFQDAMTTEDRTISFIGFNMHNGLSDTRQLAFQLTFTDGTSGIFTTFIPEPTSLALLGVGGLALLRRRPA